ncbi:nucleotidyl transferase AbiEii/AbiGii toxin family protein [Rhodoferax sp.]|uniref:nucleotidyl transferase AbiEii/AbiGii toxin family protein n=1 Tax=Rhodoferax sp. TaxID=50421 RepID=UPI002622C4A0|nr:nucleotidyl transferase AbiEii/AbiGii toxin family protein [Rhodoferax sp.]MDD3934895.1 nucleotidyl transferase AbiEii/AbiGii toxin family protein [Rhodoferax sp.]
MTLATRFLSLPLERRALAFEQAAAGLAGQAVILEKDFWVSWLLGLLFAQPELAPFLVFKGGTSLSKVFGVIDRFSEDIDLCLVPEFVGADALGFDALTSRVKRDAAVLEMQRLCADKVQQVFLPVLEGAINAALGTAPAGKWLYYELDVDAKSPILYFRYPTSQGHGFDYVRREVKLELGTLTDQQPTGRYPIAPLIAGVFAPLFSDWQCEVVALELQRTFWEKATILHSEYHRPPDSPTPDRYARHYFDMVRLLAHADASQFLADKAQCERVVDWKNRVFARGWARYDLACHGTFRLVPPMARQADLARDYATMRPMFMTEPPSFDVLLRELGNAENAINSKLMP